MINTTFVFIIDFLIYDVKQIFIKRGEGAVKKRVTAKPKAYENEKYAFRCFLLRLGLIGAEYKTSRKILLKNLSGNSSWKSGHRKEADEHEGSGQGAD